MKLHEFKYVEKEKKKQMLCECGVYLASRQEGLYTIHLYQIDAFYVEAYFMDDEEEVGYMKAFTSIDHLSPYLRDIDILDIL
ncbi:MAG: hypothetical protein ACJ75B_12090 [Flavisolibacter sp.]|jgi:hypothetical protein